MSKPILCLDFDGVIHSYRRGWKGADVIPDPVVPGTVDFIHRAMTHFTVAVYSSRSGQPGGIEAMKQYLWEAWGAERGAWSETRDEFRDIIWPTEKPSAMVTIDDRAITFTGTWPEIATLIAFKPWNKP